MSRKKLKQHKHPKPTVGKSRTFSKKQEFLLRLLLVVFPVILMFCLEFVLRLAHFGYGNRVFQPSTADSRYLEIVPDLGKRYFPSGSFYPSVSHNFMLAEKPANGFRIFVLGGSTARGYPYYYNGSFSSMLKVMLEKSYPGTYFEVVNLAMVAVNSYTVRDLLPHLWKYNPDLILIYSGHNEFYGALGVGSVEHMGNARSLVLLSLKLNTYRTYQAMRSIIHWIKKQFHQSMGTSAPSSGTVMERMVGKKAIGYHDRTYMNALNIYRKNMADIIASCKSHRIPLIIGDLVSNVHHQKPFVDLQSPVENEEEWQTHFQQAKQVFRSQNWQSAKAHFLACTESDSLPATPYFFLGQIEEHLTDSVAAYRYYYQAKDHDALRFRAPEDFNRVLRHLTGEAHIPLAPVKQFFEDASPGRIPGKELMLEHLHPNLKGYFTMAKAFYRAFLQSNLLPQKPEQLPEEDVLRKSLGLTPLDEEVGRIRIQVLTSGWPFVKGKVGNIQSIHYQPKNKMQELALSYWKNEITWEQAHVYLADHYLKSKQYELAEQEFRCLIVFTPFNPSPYQHLTNLLLGERRYDEAIPLLKKLIRNTNDNFGYRALGYIYLQKNFPDKAIRYFKKALSQNRNDQQSLYFISVASFQLGQLENAQNYLTRLRQQNPNFPGAEDLYRKVISQKKK